MPVLYFGLAALPGFRRKSRLVFLLYFSPCRPLCFALLPSFRPESSGAWISLRISTSKASLKVASASTFIDSMINTNNTWSLSFAFLFYMTIPLLLKMFALLNRRYELLFAAMFLFCLVTALMFPNALAGSWRFMAFSFGILLIPAISFIDRREPLRLWIERWGWLSLVCVFGCQVSWVGVFAAAVHEIQQSFYLLCDLAFFFLVLSALSDGGPLRKIFLLMPLRFVGNISYSLYLFHGFIITILGNYSIPQDFCRHVAGVCRRTWPDRGRLQLCFLLCGNRIFLAQENPKTALGR